MNNNNNFDQISENEGWWSGRGSRDYMIQSENIDVNTTILLASDVPNSTTGNKRFSYETVESFDEFALRLLVENMNAYEILPPNCPIKPYFDLEMASDDLQMEAMKPKLDLFINWVINDIYDIFEIQLLYTDFLVLDSCRENKLSYHVLIYKQICFSDVQECKKLIKYLWHRFKNPSESEQKIVDQLTWFHKDEQRYIFDDKPYGKMQCIRLCGQSKNTNDYKLKIITEGATVHDSFVRLYEGICDRQPIEVVFGESVEKRRTKTAKVVSQEVANWDEFQTEGPTLMSSKTLTFEDLEKLDLWKRYLYMIVNKALSWEMWRNIGFAIADCGGSQNDWVEFSKLNTQQYVDGECKDFKNFRRQNDKLRNFNINTLRKLAKKCNPTYFRQQGSVFDQYFNLNLEGVKVIDETCKFVSQDNNNILDDAKLLILYAYLGRGKTTAIKRLLVENKYERVLWLSSRQTFAYFLSSEFCADCYLDKTVNIKESKKLVISVESLLKVNIQNNYDCICIDESESIFNQFSSPTMNGKYLEIFKVLLELIKRASKVVFADAFLTNRTLNFCRSLGIPMTMIKNSTSPIQRTADQLPAKIFESKLIENMKSKKLYVCFSSKTDLVKATETLKDHQVNLGLGDSFYQNALIYHADTDDRVIDSLKTINETWRKATVVVTSPTNTIGCSYSPDAEPDFHEVWINAKPTCCVRDTFQTQMRVRHLINNKMIFSLPDERAQAMAVSRNELQFDLLDSFDEFNSSKKAINIKLCDDLIAARQQTNSYENAPICNHLKTIRHIYEELEETPLALREIMHFNLFEQTISSCFYVDMFYEFLRKCGYDFNENLVEKPKKEKKKKEGQREEEVAAQQRKYKKLYKAIHPIDGKGAQEIDRLIKRKEASEMEKLQSKKFWFERNIRSDLNTITRACLFYETWLNPFKRVQFQNAINEKFSCVENLLNKDLKVSGEVLERNDMEAHKLKFIKEFNEKLGLTNSFQKDVKIDREKVEAMVGYLTEKRKEIHTVFALRDRATGDGNQYEQAIKLIMKIYSSWSETDIVNGNPTHKVAKTYVTKCDNNHWDLLKPYESTKIHDDFLHGHFLDPSI